jgi:hypothetical protein
MIPYDQIDKSDWVEFEIILEDEVLEKIKTAADLENRDVCDFISKCMYDWWQNEIKNDNLLEKYDKIEVKLPELENNHETNNSSVPHI